MVSRRTTQPRAYSCMRAYGISRLTILSDARWMLLRTCIARGWRRWIDEVVKSANEQQFQEIFLCLVRSDPAEQTRTLSAARLNGWSTRTLNASAFTPCHLLDTFATHPDIPMFESCHSTELHERCLFHDASILMHRSFRFPDLPGASFSFSSVQLSPTRNAQRFDQEEEGTRSVEHQAVSCVGLGPRLDYRVLREHGPDVNNRPPSTPHNVHVPILRMWIVNLAT